MQLCSCVRTGAVLGLLLPLVAVAQDERRLSSPNGQVEFRIFTAPEEENAIIRIAYQVFYRGTPLIQTSFMALDVWEQTPLLGEATGLISSHSETHGNYNSLAASYMQNGSLGRLLTVEARAYDEGVAFRYVIPSSTPLRELLIADEATEFALARPSDPPPTLPFISEQPGSRWIEISEVAIPNFPRMHLVRDDENILLSRLARSRSDPNIVYEGTTPFTCPWRVIMIGSTRESLAHVRIRDTLSN
jgi:alpha-glucosidase